MYAKSFLFQIALFQHFFVSIVSLLFSIQLHDNNGSTSTALFNYTFPEQEHDVVLSLETYVHSFCDIHNLRRIVCISLLETALEKAYIDDNRIEESVLYIPHFESFNSATDYMIPATVTKIQNICILYYSSDYDLLSNQFKELIMVLLKSIQLKWFDYIYFFNYGHNIHQSLMTYLQQLLHDAISTNDSSVILSIHKVVVPAIFHEFDTQYPDWVINETLKTKYNYYSF
jgi:hypothetical protein